VRVGESLDEVGGSNGNPIGNRMDIIICFSAATGI
jgi:hypothetical protein